MNDELPTEVFFVRAIPRPEEEIPFEGRRLFVLYRDMKGVNSFIYGNRHKRRQHRVWRARVVEWEEIELNG